MSRINHITIRNFRGIKDLSQSFEKENLIILIGRGDSGKSTILAAISAVLSPSWNLIFSDLDFYLQDTSKPIEIEVTLSQIPVELLKESKFGLYFTNELHNEFQDACNLSELSLVVKLTVDETLEPHWVVKARPHSAVDDKPISSKDRALFAVNHISDYTDNQFSYNRQSPLYALTKSSLEEGVTIERVKSELIRSMTDSVQEEQLKPLNGPLDNLKQTAAKLGLTLADIGAQIDIKENPYTGNSIALHNDNLPYRLHGKGSKRLMSIAIQTELTKQGGIVLIDELEQGLEPDRIITLVRILKEINEGQVFITTHSMNVVLEAEWNNLFIFNKGATQLAKVNENLDGLRRTNPQVFFAKKVICCEGKTELGFIRAFDSWVCGHKKTSLSANGIVIANAAGGNKMYTYAEELKQLGYETCVFADDDRPEELEKAKGRATKEGIPLILCKKGYCFEQQIFSDMPWEKLPLITNCRQDGFPAHNINVPEEITKKLGTNIVIEEQKKIRKDLTDLAVKKNKEWFKHIPGGEFLGTVVMECFDELPEECALKENIKSLIKWCDL